MTSSGMQVHQLRSRASARRPLWFLARGDQGEELYVSDGAGTRLVRDIWDDD